MALPGELGHDGGQCADCNTVLHMRVLRSNAGYYLGTWCECGPYSRESDYFPTHEDAQAALACYHAGEPASLRDTEFKG